MSWFADLGIQNILALTIVFFFTVFLIIKRKHLIIQKGISYIIYIVLFKGKYGLARMESWAKRFPKLISGFAVFGIAISYAGMATIGYLLVKAVFDQFLIPNAPPAVMPVLPIKASWAFYVPPLYFIICIFIIATVHEFAHGIVARRYGIPVNASGFGFIALIIPVLPLAFVEPDEKKLTKAKTSQQLAVYAAGPTSNLVLGFLLMAVMLAVSTPIYSAVYDVEGIYITPVENVSSPARMGGVSEDEFVVAIDGHAVPNGSEFLSILSKKSPGEIVHLETDEGTYDIQLGNHPENASQSYLGVYPDTKRVKADAEERMGKTGLALTFWLFGSRENMMDIGLIGWLILLNIGIGLFNFTPLSIVDGGRILLVTLEHWFDKKKAKQIWGIVSAFFLILIFVNIAFLFFQ